MTIQKIYTELKKKTWGEIRESNYTVFLDGNKLILEVKSADRMLESRINITPVYEFCKELFISDPHLLKEDIKI